MKTITPSGRCCAGGACKNLARPKCLFCLDCWTRTPPALRIRFSHAARRAPGGQAHRKALREILDHHTAALITTAP